ncbi:transmembrane protein 26-like [Mya arenaria]|uniref:transmembrane protein 26-like n=1 Tax=Mya arenaria TaxID=6604 RepID=UPI0022E116E2|nr:transmembrane protein 26-like [Mya arenaria]
MLRLRVMDGRLRLFDTGNSKAPSTEKTESRGPLAAALFVRAVFILHNLLSVWRVVVTKKDDRYWALVAANIFTLVEAFLVVKWRRGIEWKWWCPCFLAYLVSTFPAIWLLQLTQYQNAVIGPSNNGTNVTAGYQALADPQNATTDVYMNYSYNENVTSTTAIITTELVSNTTSSILDRLEGLLQLGEQTWIVVIQESLVYLIIFGRWMLPRAHTSRADLSDLLLEYLAIASDTMELYALYDEDAVQADLGITYAILALWSISFLQFVPILKNKSKFKHLQSKRTKRIQEACGDYFAEVFVTCMSVMLQDGPFLCLRLYIMLYLNLVTYSLVFFIIKNIVTIILLLYRLSILCLKLPCCYGSDGDVEAVEAVDFSRAIHMQHDTGIRIATPNGLAHRTFGSLPERSYMNGTGIFP